MQWAEIESCLGAWIANARPEFGPEIAASFQLMKQLDVTVAEALQRREQYFQSLHEFLNQRSAVHSNNTRARSLRAIHPGAVRVEPAIILGHCR